MTITLTIDKESYTAIPTKLYRRLVKRAGMEADVEGMPALPEPDEHGHRPALETGRAILAQKIIKRRLAAGWTQQQLARKAKVREETISRLEAGKHKPHTATLVKLNEALKKAGV